MITYVGTSGMITIQLITEIGQQSTKTNLFHDRKSAWMQIRERIALFRLWRHSIRCIFLSFGNYTLSPGPVMLRRSDILIFPLFIVWTSCWTHNIVAVDLRRHAVHCNVRRFGKYTLYFECLNSRCDIWTLKPHIALLQSWRSIESISNQ